MNMAVPGNSGTLLREAAGDKRDSTSATKIKTRLCTFLQQQETPAQCDTS